MMKLLKKILVLLMTLVLVASAAPLPLPWDDSAWAKAAEGGNVGAPSPIVAPITDPDDPDNDDPDNDDPDNDDPDNDDPDNDDPNNDDPNNEDPDDEPEPTPAPSATPAPAPKPASTVKVAPVAKLGVKIQGGVTIKAGSAGKARIKKVEDRTTTIKTKTKINGKTYKSFEISKSAVDKTVKTLKISGTGSIKLDAYAFKNAKALTSISFTGKCTVSVNKKAFSGLGKSKKEKIKITISKKMSKSKRNKLKKALIKAGIPRKNIKVR